MKKLRILSFILILSLVFAACTARPQTAPADTPVPQLSTPEAAPATLTPEPPAEQITEPGSTAAPETPASPERLILSVRYEEEVVYSEDGKAELIRFRAPVPVVAYPSRELAADAINAELLRLYEAVRAELDTGSAEVSPLISAAQEDYTMRLSDDAGWDFIPYELTQRVYLGRGDANVLSLIYDSYYYTGGVHGFTARSGHSFDMRTGEPLTLNALSDDPESFTAFCGEELWRLFNSEEYADRGFFEETGEEEVKALVQDGFWWLDDTGLTFVANPYELAPYAAGQIEFTLPYALLEGHMKPDYFPTPKKESIGCIGGFIGEDLYGTPVGIVDTGVTEYAQNINLSVDSLEAGDRVLPAFSVFRVEYAEWMEDYTERELLWYAEWLEPEEEVLIRAEIPEFFSDIGIRFMGSDGWMRYVLGQSGQDGSLAFTAFG